MLEMLALPFFQRVLLAGLMISLACGIIGSLVVVKRISSITGGISHAAFGGVGLGFLLGFNPLWGAMGFALLSAAVIAVISKRLPSGLDTLISMFWSVGMALGILFVSLTPGYAPDLTGYLFGSLLFVSWDYIGLVAALDVLILVCMVLAYRRFQAVSFDEEFSQIIGLRVEWLFLVILSLSALTVVTLMRVAGVILAIALLTVPAATARLWSQSLKGMMWSATALTAFCTCAGLLLSAYVSTAHNIAAPAGPAIVLVSVMLYCTAAVCRWLSTR